MLSTTWSPDLRRPAYSTRVLCEVANERGIATSEILAGTGIAPADLNDSEALVAASGEIAAARRLLGLLPDAEGLGIDVEILKVAHRLPAQELSAHFVVRSKRTFKEHNRAPGFGELRGKCCASDASSDHQCPLDVAHALRTRSTQIRNGKYQLTLAALAGTPARASRAGKRRP